MLELSGRFHLVVLHLPIGFLLLAGMMEVATRFFNGALRPAVGFILFWGMVSALLASVLGYLLSLGGSYDGNLLNWHQWSGFCTAGLSTALYFLHKKNKDSGVYLPLFGLTLFSLLLTGHFGGSLTHGSGFLFEKNKTANPAPLTIAGIDSAQVFSQVVLPVLKDKCGNCHNPSKRKGGLAILTKEDILKGGENGPILLPADPAESPMLKSISAPPDNDLHMPPKGKKQLTEQEKQLLLWWITSGAPFEKTVAECAMPEAVYSSLTKKVNLESDLLATLKLDPASDGSLKKLKEQGIFALPLAQNSPFLQVSFSSRKDLSATVLNNLKKVGKNIVHLDFANSNLDDAMLAIVKDLPHLNRLDLRQTGVTDTGLANLTGLTFLEHLNLFDTKVTDAGLEQLRRLPNLKSVYLWQTDVTEQGVATFVAAKPNIFINKGLENDSMFSEIALRPPLFKTTEVFFTDTFAVELEAGFGKALIRYTTDGTDPDSTSLVYEKPVLLDTSTEVKAMAFKPNWKPSEVVSMVFTKVRYQAKEISLAHAPNKRYAGGGAKTLVDFRKGGPQYRSEGWIGFEGENCVATIDLGAVCEVSKVTVGSIEDTNAWVFFPKGLRVSTSIDGESFKLVRNASYPIARVQTQPSSKVFTENFKREKARYVKVEVLSVLKNPKWHPGAGKPCWVFVDEIVLD